MPNMFRNILSTARMQHVLDLAADHERALTATATLVVIGCASYYFIPKRRNVPSSLVAASTPTPAPAQASASSLFFSDVVAPDPGPSNRPAPINTSGQSTIGPINPLTGRPWSTPEDQTDYSPPIEYGSLAPGPRSMDHHELMLRKRAVAAQGRLAATASDGRNQSVAASMARVRDIIGGGGQRDERREEREAADGEGHEEVGDEAGEGDDEDHGNEKANEDQKQE